MEYHVAFDAAPDLDRVESLLLDADPAAVADLDPHAAPVLRVSTLLARGELQDLLQRAGYPVAPDRIRLRVWERGAGLTKACGTGACAALVATARRGLTGREAVVEVDGGELTIAWDEASGHVFMTGPVEVERTGQLSF